MKKISLSRRIFYLGIIICALGCLAVSTVQATESLLPAISRPEVLLPHDSDELAWRYNMKMADFTGGCVCLVYDLNTPELIDWRIDRMKKEGLNTIIVSGYHMHQCHIERWPGIVEYMKILTRKAHENGMKVIFHHDVQLIFNLGTGLNRLMAHIDWLQRDIQYDTPIFNGFCLNNPDFKKDYFTRIEDLVRRTEIDGVMLDDLTFLDKTCGCKYCRKRFCEETGFSLPRENDSPVFFNQKSQLWLAWLKWRKKSVGDWWVDMRKMLNTVNPDCCIMIYTTHGGFSHNWASISLGYDIFELARGCDFLGTEIMSRNVYDSYRAVYAYRKAKAGLGDLYKSSIWGLVYHINDPVYAYFGWAMNHMNRQTTWMATIEGEDMSRYLDWSKQMNCRDAKPMPDVAVVFSSNVRDFGKIFPGITDVLGTSQCLSDAHIQHKIIMQDELLNSLNLSRYKLLILPCMGNMSTVEVQSVWQYVEMGGTLFASGHTSLLDENGFLQTNFQLADAMGVDSISESPYKSPVTVRMKANGKTIAVPYAAMKVKLRKGTKVSAEIINKEQHAISPAVVSHAYGKGQCLYSAIPLGIVNNQPEYGYNKMMNYEKNQEVFDFYMSLVKDIVYDKLDFKSIKIPEKVLVNVWQQNTDEKKEILIHLLNATGTGSDLIKSDWEKRGNPFPPLIEDIVFDIRPGANIKNGIIASPDYKDERPVVIEKKDNGYYRVTVKKEDLQAYAIVYLNLQKDKN